MMKRSQRKKTGGSGLRKALALVLCAATLLPFLLSGAASLTAEAAENEHAVYCGEEAVTSVSLPQDGKCTLSVVERDGAAYAWQLSVGGGEEQQWVTVSGRKQSTLTLSYAMVASLLDSRGVTRVRSVIQTGETSSVSRPVTVRVDYTAAPESAQPVQALPALRRAPARSGGDSQWSTYTVTVNFVYEDGTPVADPYVASIEAGGAFRAVVEFPEVVGYLPYFAENTESTGQYTIDLAAVTENVTYTVTYKPALVKYQVHHYLQNIQDDNYTLAQTIQREGLTGSSIGDACAMDMDGFTPLYYDKEIKIAADGSTEVEIYYDRNYYLLSFDLGGGYGVDPIYTRYGATVSPGRPTRPGFSFTGWELTACDGAAASDAQKKQYDLNPGSVTVPAMSLQYRAIWEPSSATYTIVYWTENADDDGYSYFDHTTLQAASGTTVSGSEYTGSKDITHFTLNREKTERNVTVKGDGSTIVNVYYSRNRYTITFPGVSGGDMICGREAHVHSYDESYTTRRQTYYCGGCYPPATAHDWWGNPTAGGAAVGGEICGKEAHTHDNSCYSSLADYTVTTKYDADISYVWENEPIRSLLDMGYVFRSSITGKYYSFLEKMPSQDVTMTPTQWSGSTYEWYYWLEVRPGQDTTGLETTTAGGRTYYKYHTTVVKGNGISLTYEEDYYPITGFTQRDKRVPSFNDRKADLYYLRNSHTLTFHNYDADVSGQGGSLAYETPLADYYFEPEYPENLEAGAYRFAGWYTTPQCFDGSEVDFSAATMPDADLLLYAKWVPASHTVRVFKTAAMTQEELLGQQTVPHGGYAQAPEDFENGGYVFSGWFYLDGGVKKAFDFANMPVTRDLDIFAEWSSRVPVQYTIRYELADGTPVAEPTLGSTLAGTSKTFTAKAGTQLFDAYREGYFPQTSSHTILMDIAGGNTFTFVYTPRENVPYTVRYLEKGTGKVLHEEKYVAENRKSVVTETFQQISGYMPDAYQKRLVLSANAGENVLTFWYTQDSENAYYMIVHWVQNLEGDGYTEYRTIQSPGRIGDVIREEPLTIAGCTYNGGKSNASGEIGPDGLVLNLYYDRNLYAYTVEYLEAGTEKKLLDDKSSGAAYRYGKLVSEEAPEISGYTLVSTSPKQLTISDRAQRNVIRFYYTEQQVTIHYAAVGGGTVSLGSETVKAVTGTAVGSVPTPGKGYRFVGWFTDGACTTPAPADWVTGGQLIPQKQDGRYRAATYYAKFTEDTAALTIQKTGWDAADENQTFLFSICGTDENTETIRMTVTVHGNGRTTVTDLPVGSYTVAEVDGWSWRYAPESARQSVRLDAPGATVVFQNDRPQPYWLDGDSYSVNHFIKDR